MAPSAKSLHNSPRHGSNKPEPLRAHASGSVGNAPLHAVAKAVCPGRYRAAGFLPDYLRVIDADRGCGLYIQRVFAPALDRSSDSFHLLRIGLGCAAAGELALCACRSADVERGGFHAGPLLSAERNDSRARVDLAVPHRTSELSQPFLPHLPTRVRLHHPAGKSGPQYRSLAQARIARRHSSLPGPFGSSRRTSPWPIFTAD